MEFPVSSRRPRTPQLTPLIDVVFLLLVFFLLAGTFVAPTPFPVRLPTADPGSAGPPANVVIFVRDDGQVAFNDFSGSLAEFESALRARLARGTVDSLTIQADAGAPSGVVVEILRRTERAGVTSIRLLTMTPP